MNITPFQCQLCENKPFFARRYTLNRHIASLHKKSTESFECAHCSKTFFYKHSLQRHIAALHLYPNNEKLIACVHCTKTFRYKYNLRRHIATFHPNVKGINNEQLVECAHCSKRFRYKQSLSRHIAAFHSDASGNGKLIECAHCSKTFGYKHSLSRHIASVHPETINEYHKFECLHCSSTFTKKTELRRHIRKLHLEQVSYQCSKCPDGFRSFSSKRNLRRHIRLTHCNSSTGFECFHCSSTFARKYHLYRHIQRVHFTKKQRIKESHFRCLKCSKVVCSTKVLNKHYADAHDVILNYEKLEFDCVQSYEQWLEKHQHETITRYIICYRKKKSASYYFQRLVCHRSGHTRSSLTVDSRKRCLKTSGYKRLGGICPAEIRLHIRDDGTCFVIFQKTHVGHNIGDASELKYIYLTSKEKRKIAAEIQSGVPVSKIVTGQRLMKSSDPDRIKSRLTLLTRRDVRNVAVSQNLDVDNYAHVERKCDAVEVKIDDHKDDIIFHKRQGEVDTRFNVLRSEDCVLVVMTSNQERYLRSYGHKVISLDDTLGTNADGLALHTLLVFDIDEEKLPAAFLLTNRHDQCAVDIFLTCIRDRVGVLAPHTLIASVYTTYYNSWIRIMNKPTYFVVYTWHVHEAWRKNYHRIANKMKRDDVRTELHRLSHELDPIKFENGLHAFLSRDDQELADFQRYFRMNFGSNAEQWAYCYQSTACVNTSLAIESFHRSFKHNLAGHWKTLSLTQCLVHIFNFLALLETSIFEKNIRGKITNKLSMLRSRHREAFEHHKEYAFSRVIVIAEDMYMVQSFENVDRFYTITRHELKECGRENSANVASECCRLVCDSCNLCFHDFSCTCEDSSIKSNMCKHIHLVGLHLKSQAQESDAHTVECKDDEVDVSISYITDCENASPAKDRNVLESAVSIASAGNKKQKLIEQITEQWEDIRNAFTTSTENELESICNEMKPAASLAKNPASKTHSYTWKKIEHSKGQSFIFYSTSFSENSK